MSECCKQNTRAEYGSRSQVVPAEGQLGTQSAPVANPAPVAHRPLAVAAVDVQRCGRLVQAGDGAARTQLDDLIGHVPQLETLQQVYVGHVPVFLKWKHGLLRVARPV